MIKKATTTAISAMSIGILLVVAPSLASATDLGSCRQTQKYLDYQEPGNGDSVKLVTYRANCPSGKVKSSTTNFFSNPSQISGTAFGRTFTVVEKRRGMVVRLRGTYGMKVYKARIKAVRGENSDDRRVTATFGSKSVTCRTSVAYTSPDINDARWGTLRVNGSDRPPRSTAWKRCAFTVLVSEAYRFNAGV